METLLIVAIAVGIAWFFLSGTYSTKVKDPADMRGAELEDVFIDLKKKSLLPAWMNKSICIRCCMRDSK